MKNKIKKLTAGLIMAVMAMTVFFAMIGCGGTPAAKLTGSYNSGAHLDFFSAYPLATYRQMTCLVQNLKTYDDGTYILTVSSTTFSGGLSFDPEGTGNQNASATPRGSEVKEYYGTCTSTEEDGLVTITLTMPTRVTLNTRSTSVIGYYADSNMWTDEMGEKTGSAEEPLTAEQFLAKHAFQETIIIANRAAVDFDYTRLIVPAA